MPVNIIWKNWVPEYNGNDKKRMQSHTHIEAQREIETEKE